MTQMCALVAAVILAGAADEVEVLNERTLLRVYNVFRTPVAVTADGELKTPLEPVGRDPKPIPDFQSPLPPADWRSAEFDDADWARRRAPIEHDRGRASGRSHAARHTATPNAMICIRGKFHVDDPAKADGLTLTLEYVGGVVVYVNGREVARAHLPAGDLPLEPAGREVLAEKYPDDLYCEPEGMFLQNPAKNPEGFARRYRRLAGVAIPANLLRRGTNVLALEVRRAPINQAAIDAVRVPEGGMYRVPGIWAYAGLKSISLKAPASSAVVPNIGPPKGTQVWTCPAFETIDVNAYGDPEPPRPIRLTAARNGVFSGRVVVNRDAAIRGLKATPSPLRTACGATLPPSGVQVRYAEPAVPEKSWTPRNRFDGLVDQIPAEIPAPGGRAMANLWLTVRVPADAQAGTYQGAVTVQAEDLAPTAVPVHLTVCDWTLPDPKDFRTHNLGFASQESMATHYGIPMWGDRHFEMMGRSLELMAEVGSRQVLVNLAISWYGGSNNETMIRWIRNADGTYGHDFTIFDKYLDTAARAIGKPRPLRINCWGDLRQEKDGTVRWYGPNAVSLVDPATGQLESLVMPPPDVGDSTDCLDFWKPVLDEARRKIEARGWFDVTCLGHNAYASPPKPPVVSMAWGIWPDGAWGVTSHSVGLGTLPGLEKEHGMPCRYSEVVWTEGRVTPRGQKALLRPRPGIWNSNARNRHYDRSPIIVLRKLPEEMAMRGHDGVGQFGVDFFPLKNPQGRIYFMSNDRGGTGPQCSTLAILAPGPDGPVATERFEMFREGVELVEAMIYLERQLAEGRIPDDLAARVNRYLDQRAEAFIKEWEENRVGRDAQLLALCGEVAAAAAGRP